MPSVVRGKKNEDGSPVVYLYLSVTNSEEQVEIRLTLVRLIWENHKGPGPNGCFHPRVPYQG